MDIICDQVRGARALLRLARADLARRTGVSLVTIRRIEAPAEASNVSGATVAAVVAALEAAGAEFIDGGVRRREDPANVARWLQEHLRRESDGIDAIIRGRLIMTDHDLYDENGLPAGNGDFSQTDIEPAIRSKSLSRIG